MLFRSCEYYCIYPDHFSDEDIRKWLSEKNNLKTDIGYQLFDRLITQNKEFAAVVGALQPEEKDLHRE